MAAMRILIANDDGYLAPGIAALLRPARAWATST
jgi:broad specificity polyphosphatase/5'/3'-nucleotidase SurE